ncbi:MAG: hypothetical protein GX444_13210 [Myxococcales bacterium]|nr:hypothetical protein [Myxococcales bacterium]
MHGKRWLIVGWLLLLALTAACQANRTAPQDMPDTASWWEQTAKPEDESELRQKVRGLVDHIRERRVDYLLGAEDVVRITVWNRVDLSKETRIRPDGTLFMPLVGNVKAEGLTITQLQESLRQQLGRVLRDPQVDVEIKEYGSKVYYVFGQAIKPGVYPVRATTTLLEGVATAGGPADKANLGYSYLIRGGLVVPIDFYALFERGDISQNLLLADGDIIYLPSIEDAKIYVLGEVNAAAAVPMRSHSMRLSEAVALAGGFNETTAFKRGIKVIRGSLANPRVYTVDYQEVMRGEKPDVPFLQNGDIVFVPASGLTKWDRVLGQLLPNLSQIVLDAASIDSLTRNR